MEERAHARKNELTIELMQGRRSSHEGARGGTRAGKKELMEELARTTSPNNGRQQRSWLGEEIV
jgi:hypothetical protein